MPDPVKHLLLATTEDAFNPKAWSGIPFSLRAALERTVEKVTVFRPTPPSRLQPAALRRILSGPQKYPLWISQTTLRQNARQLNKEIARTRPDAVLSISSQCVCYLDPPAVPVFLFSDAPYLAFAEAYATWETYPVRIAQFGREEAAAGRRLDGLCFGSAWACSEARRLYSLPAAADTLHVTPLGANWIPTQSREEILRRMHARTAAAPGARVDFLFVGRDWERKGGPLAVEIVGLLRAAGRNAHLHIVGCHPDLSPEAQAFTTTHGLLYQTDPVQSATLAELFLRSHFLLVPTLAECFGIVFAEAQAFAVPPISRAVHALPSVVLDGQTGLLFPPDAHAAAYLPRIQALLDDPAAYLALAAAARQRFQQELTWDATALHILNAINALPTPRRTT